MLMQENGITFEAEIVVKSNPVLTTVKEKQNYPSTFNKDPEPFKKRLRVTLPKAVPYNTTAVLSLLQ